MNHVLKFCQISYRSGTRFNPDEITFKGKKRADDDDDKAEKKDSVVTEQPKIVVSSEIGDEEIIELAKFAGTGAVPKKAKKKVGGARFNAVTGFDTLYSTKVQY